MWPFNRNKPSDQTGMPAELQEYYQAEQRERMGVAWVLAMVTLAVTVAVVLGLFFGGRAIYHAVKHKNNKPVATVSKPTTPTSNPSSTSKSPTTSTPSQPNTSQSQPTQTNKPATNNPTSPTTTSNSTPPTSTAPANQPKPQAITNTGPGQTAAIGFGSASVLGFLLYEWRLRRKLN